MEPHSRRQHGTFLFPQAIVLLLKSVSVSASEKAVTPNLTDVSRPWDFDRIRKTLYRLLIQLIPFAHRGDLSYSKYIVVGMVQFAAICGLGTLLWKRSRPKLERESDPSDDTASIRSNDDIASSDPGLLQRYSTTKSYDVPSTGFRYPGIRTFYRPHNQEDKLPQEPCPIPLLVFIHGLGGSIAQFHPILKSLVDCASVLAIDLPGCGLSTFQPKNGDAYTPKALVHLLAIAIEAHRNQDAGQGVVLVGHSMGCSLAALLASSTSPYANLMSQHVLGLVAICPLAQPPPASKGLKLTTSLPALIFDLYRLQDKLGGVNSNSVLRMTGPGAEEETKKLQLRFNRQSRTPVWQRMAKGLLPDRNGISQFPGEETWAGLEIPVHLFAGEADTVTSPDNIITIARFLGRDIKNISEPSEEASLPIAAAPVVSATVDTALSGRKGKDSGVDASDLPLADKEKDDAVSSLLSSAGGTGTSPEDVFTPDDSNAAADKTSSNTATLQSTDAPSPHPRHLVVKTNIFPRPAAHSMLFAPSTSRILSGFIRTFLSDHIDPRLSLGWQLQYLTKEGKWDVKNLKKWQEYQPVSPPIAGFFRAMKTLREVDDVHSPAAFVKQHADQIRVVVDISHDQPVYDPKGLEAGGVKYIKFPTVSKLPPSADETMEFVALVDKLEQEKDAEDKRLVGVHCHYGYNRTGFFLVCYLVERLGFTVGNAIAEFKKQRPPGIRHEHFIDALHTKYSQGIRRAPTF